MEPRSSSLPTTTPDAGILDLWQGLIVGLGPLAAAYDRRWCPRRRVLDTLRVMLFVFLLACARRQGCTTTLAELWAPCRGLDAPLPQPISAAARSKARPQLDENEFKPCHPEILRRAAPPGAQGLLSCRSPWIPSRAAANAGGAGAASRGPTAAPTGVSQRDPPGTFASGSGLVAASGTRTAHTGDNPSAQSRNGADSDPRPHSAPDVDSAERRNGRDSSPSKPQKHSIHPQNP